MNYSKGITWFDDCRIPFVDELRTIPIHSEDKKDDTTLFRLHPTIQRKRVETTQGRFPANLLVSDDMLNDGSITGGKDFNITTNKNDTINWGFKNTTNRKIKQDKGTNSRYYDIDAWFNNLINNI